MIASHVHMKHVAITCAIACFFCFAGKSSAAAPTLADVLRAAESRLELRISTQLERAAEADRTTADRAPLPILSAKASQIDFQNGIGAGDILGRKRIDKSIGLDWTWERGDKRLHRTRASQGLMDAAAADTKEVLLLQMMSAQTAYFDWLSARERSRLMRETLDVANAAISAANARLKAGDVSAQDVLRIEIDAGRVETDLQSSLLDLERSEIALAQFVDRSSLVQARNHAVDWPIPQQPSESRGLLSPSIEDRADVQAARSRVAAATASLDGARALKRIDPTWGVSFDHYPGTSSRLVELRVQIPLASSSRYDGEITRALADLSQAELVAERVARDARAEVLRLEAEATNSASRATQFEVNIVPRAATVLRQAEFAYARGALALTDLLDARRTHRVTQIDAVNARSDAAKAYVAHALRTHPDSLLR